MLEKVRIVLVHTSHPGNIGAAARAIKNMGLRHLTLVCPKHFPSPEANVRAAGAEDLLAAATITPTLTQALADTTFVVGASARARSLPWPLLDPRETAMLCLEKAQQGASIALVFGREDSGLTNKELQQCHYHTCIPAVPEFSSLNLASAVQVLTYELRMAWLHQQSSKNLKDFSACRSNPPQPVATEDLEKFFAHLEKTLVQIGFLDQDNPRQLMARLRRLYSRCSITQTEMNILRGILTETQRAIGYTL